MEEIFVNPPLRCKTNDEKSYQLVAMTQSGLALGRKISNGEASSIGLTIFLDDRPACKVQLSPHGVRQDRQKWMYELADQQSLLILNDIRGQLRKSQHIQICQENDVESSDKKNGFDAFRFWPKSLPELDWEDLQLDTVFLGSSFSAPLMITGMTGGVARGKEINLRLAYAADQLDIPMGVGSQRIALENKDLAPVFQVKQQFPNVFLIGNLGVQQILSPHAISLAKQAVEMIGADALAIHINTLQELVQVEGDRKFRGALSAIETLSQNLKVPIMVKEVGSGIDPNTAKILNTMNLGCLDIGGRGGTSWGYIEGLRSSSPQTRAVGETFRDWGLTTAESLLQVRKHCPKLPLVATGGVRNGLQVAKALALGADMVGIGLPLMRSALDAMDGPYQVLTKIIRELKITMMCTGSNQCHDLKNCLAHELEFSPDIR